MGRSLVRRAVVAGVVAGIVAMVVFFALHAVLVEPIWQDAILRGTAVAVLGGGVMGWMYLRYRPSLPVEPRWRGVWFGALVALYLVPFLVAGYVRIHGGGVLWAGATVVLGLTAVFGAYLQGTRVEEEPVGRGVAVRALRFMGVVAVLNAVPAAFLFDLVRIVDDHVPDPFPMASVLMAVYVMAGAIVGSSVPERT